MTVTDTAPREKFASFPSGSLRYGGEEFHAIGKSHGGGWDVDQVADAYRQHMGDRVHRLSGAKLEQDRKSVVSGKRVSVRVDPGGRRIIKKKNTKEHTRYIITRKRKN